MISNIIWNVNYYSLDFKFYYPMEKVWYKNIIFVGDQKI
jgi:hypothetical protein